MRLLTRYPGHLGLVGMLFLSSLGCSHTPVGPSPLAAEVRAQLGRIGVAYRGPVSLTVTAKPLRGAGQGARRGALTAAGGVVEMLKGPGDPMGTAGLILFSPGIVAVGALVGAVLAPSAESVAAAEAILAHAVADPDLPVAVRECILRAVQGRRPQAVPAFPESDSAANEEAIAQAVHSQQGLDTLLEVHGPIIVLQKGDYAGNINPVLRLSVSLSSRLVRTADGEWLYTYSPQYRGESRPFTAWAANNAQPLRDEVARASESLAKDLVLQLFGPAQPSEGKTGMP
jgi:hypothetical protein